MPDSPSPQRTGWWAVDICRPAPLFAIALLLVNDHALKGSGAVPASATGKLSDLAGLFFFPILCAVLARGAFLAMGRTRAARSRTLIFVSIAATAAAFTCLKLWPAFNRAAAACWGENVMDPTDLWTLPVLSLSWLWMLEQRSASRTSDRYRPRWAPAAAIALAAFASMATPAPRHPRNFPMWRIVSGAAKVHECADAIAWVSKSGKTGVGISIDIRTRGEGECRVRIEKATLVLADGPEVAARTTGPALGSRGAGSRYLYLPFVFDNNRMWNQGIRDGTFELHLSVNGRVEPWQLRAEHRLLGFHKDLQNPQMDRQRERRWRAR